MNLDNLKASDGSGDAARATVTNLRSIAASTLKVSTTTAWPAKFIATSGTLNATSKMLDSGTITVFYGHLSGSDIIIDGYAPGYSDIGHTVSQVVTIKPVSAWTDTLVDSLENTLNPDGTLKTDSVTTPKIKDGAVTGAKILNNRVQYQTQNGGTTANVDGKDVTLQMGWGQIAGTGGPLLGGAVTFPTAFTTVLGVTISYLGVKPGVAAADITQLTVGYTTAAFTINASSPSPTGFTANLRRNPDSFASGTYYGFAWTAWGIL